MAKKNGRQQTPESVEHEAFRVEFERRTVLYFRLHKHLLSMIQYLGAYEDVGIDADGKRSAEVALVQHHILADEVQQALECAVELPQTEFMIALNVALLTVGQNIQIAATKTGKGPNDRVTDGAIIASVKQAVQESYDEAYGPLKRMAAFLLTYESLADIRARTQVLEEQYGLVQMMKANDTYDYNEDPVLTETEQAILVCLRDKGALMIQSEMVHAVTAGDGTVQNAMQNLERWGFVHRPRGERKGYGLTQKGEEEASRIKPSDGARIK